MRRNRIIIYILWVLSLVGISFYGGPVTYGFFFIVTLIPIVSLAYIGVVMLCFRTYQKIGTRNPIVNTPTPFFFTMQNGAFFTFSGIKLNFHSSFSTITGLDGNQEYELSPFTEITKETQLVCKYRGHYDVGVKSFEITDFLRLFKIRFSLKDSLNEIVNPYLAEISSLKGFDSAKFLPRNSYSNPTETDCEVRDYVPGDSLRRIHWNISAKEHALKVRKTIGEEKQGVTIIADMRKVGDTLDIQLPSENKIIETVLATSFYFAKSRIPTTVFWQQGGEKRRNISDVASFDALYKEMADVSFTEEADGYALAEKLLMSDVVRRSAFIILILHELTDKTVGLLDRYSSLGIPVSVYVCTNDTARVSSNGLRANITYVPLECDLKEVL